MPGWDFVHTHNSPGGASPLFHMSPPSSGAGQTGSSAPLLPPPPAYCLSVRLRVRNMMESDFRTVRPLSPIVPWQNGSGNWATEEGSRCLLQGAGTKAGTHNGFSVRSRRSVVIIKGHKSLNGCKMCNRKEVLEASGGNSGLASSGDF